MVGTPEGIKHHQISLGTVTNDGRLISEEFSNGHEFLKMCIVCILFLLAVHRLVLIVNSLGCCRGSGTGEGRKFIPYY